MRTNLIENLLRRHFGLRAEPIVENFVNSPQMDAVLAEMDAKNVALRRELVAKLATVPERHEAGCMAAAAAEKEAAQAVVAASAAFEAAQSHHMLVMSASVSASTLFEREASQLCRELESTADPRLETFAQGCIDIFMVVRHRTPKQIVDYEGSSGKKISYDPTDLNAALAALQASAAQARAMKLQALTFDEITTALESLRAGLMPLLARTSYKGAPPAADGSTAQSLHLLH